MTCKHRGVKHATAAKVLCCDVKQGERKLCFLNPGASERGSNKAVGTIDNHFTRVQCHCKPHSSLLPLYVCVLLRAFMCAFVCRRVGR